MPKTFSTTALPCFGGLDRHGCSVTVAIAGYGEMRRGLRWSQRRPMSRTRVASLPSRLGSRQAFGHAESDCAAASFTPDDRSGLRKAPRLARLSVGQTGGRGPVRDPPRAPRTLRSPRRADDAATAGIETE